VIRRLPRDYPIFERMNQGDQYPDAHRVAIELWHEKMAILGLADSDADPLSPKHDLYEAERATIVPPYDPNKFIDKWRKMAEDEPARTLTAHLGKDSYTHIHYDDSQARTISVREAARLQSFPDGFTFEGAMNAAFRQIGNAVPPLLARALALHIANEIGAATRDSFEARLRATLASYGSGGASDVHIAAQRSMSH
jgi:DNA (cytosine-5)-methyltransferase 1